MTDQRQMICDFCRKAVSLTDIRYMPKGKDGRTALCSTCRTKHPGTADSKKAALTGEKKKYFCTRCRYKFTFDPKSISNMMCPFCGKNDKIIEDQVKGADSLLKGKIERF